MDWLSGKKTYIGIIVGTVWSLIGVFGIADPGSDYFAAIAAIIVAFTGVSIRLGIEKSGQPPQE
jgi:hypothetical protein